LHFEIEGVGGGEIRNKEQKIRNLEVGCKNVKNARE